MKVVSTGNTFKIYDDSLKTFDKLPNQVYLVKFNQMTGFYLEKFSDIEVKEKVYGVHQTKVDKVMNSFKTFERSLGVILSGAKSIGKSLCAKLLSERAVKEGYPLIIVNGYIPGIADYLNEIEQEVVVLFDEFDKTFFAGGNNRENSVNDPQTEMLSLFDGISQGKKLFIVTCNELRNLNNYLVNRPGRFHYHFRFDYPSSEEITEYLEDKIDEVYFKEIEKVISFSRKVDLNYDCLRAIAFELQSGISFEEAIQDLNIINLSMEIYNLTLVFQDGTKLKYNRSALDMFDDNETCINFCDDKGRDVYVYFTPSDNTYDLAKGGCVVLDDVIKIDWDERDFGDSEEGKADLAASKAKKVDYLLIRRCRDKDIHYAV